MSDDRRLYPGACEPFSWPVDFTDAAGQPVVLAELEVAFTSGPAPSDGDAAYQTVPVVDGRVEVLLAHPATATVPGATVLPVGHHIPWFRAVDGTSKIPRPGAAIYVM